MLSLPFATIPRRLLRHRVTPSAAEATSLENPAVYRHWPHMLLYAAPLPAGAAAAAAANSSSSSSSRKDQPREVLAAAEEQLLLRGSWAGRPLADTPAAALKSQNKNACNDLIHLLMLQEIKRLQKRRTFKVRRSSWSSSCCCCCYCCCCCCCCCKSCYLLLLLVLQMPGFGPGDLVEVQYELSRSQQTVATFQGMPRV